MVMVRTFIPNTAFAITGIADLAGTNVGANSISTCGIRVTRTWNLTLISVCHGWKTELPKLIKIMENY